MINKNWTLFILFTVSIMAGNAQSTMVVADSLLTYIKKEAQYPADYLVEKFKTTDVILLGEHHLIKQNLEFLHSMIPILYKNGVYTIGMEFGASEDQAALDALINAPKYDVAKARQLMFNYNVGWGYKEYIEAYQKVWGFNKNLPPGARKFRILNLSYQYDWTKFDGARTPKSMQQVFHKGTADKYRAELIEREILQKSEKMLALVGTPHAYTRYASPVFLYNNDNFCAYDSAWLGNRLYQKYGDKIKNVILHQAFYNFPNQKPFLLSPANGQIEALMAQNANKPVGFDLLNSPLGKLKETSIHSMCYDDFRLEQFFDGYIFLAPLKELEGCTVDEQFLNEQNITTALKNQPDPDWHGRMKNLEEMRALIRKGSAQIKLDYSKL